MISDSSSDLVDLVDLGAAARTECYEIAAYESLRRMAKAMGEEAVVELLDQNLPRKRTLFATLRSSPPASVARRRRRQPAEGRDRARQGRIRGGDR